jgi:hypothetical protein
MKIGKCTKCHKATGCRADKWAIDCVNCQCKGDCNLLESKLFSTVKEVCKECAKKQAQKEQDCKQFWNCR